MGNPSPTVYQFICAKYGGISQNAVPYNKDSKGILQILYKYTSPYCRGLAVSDSPPSLPPFVGKVDLP